MKETFIYSILKVKGLFVTFFSGFNELLIYIAAMLISLMIPYKDEVIFVFTIVVIDWLLAMFINAKKGNLRSARVKNVVGKIIFYSLGYLIAGGLDRFIGIELLGAVVSSALLISEILSVFANMLIIWPNIPVIPKLKRFLEKELERKLNNTSDGKEDE